MIKYVIRRCIMMIFVLLGVSFLIYFLKSDWIHGLEKIR